MPDRVERVVRAANEGLQTQRVDRVGPLEERGSNDVRAGLERDADVRPRLDVVSRLRHVLEVGSEIFFATNPRQVDACAVNRVFELVLVFKAADDAKICAEQTDRKVVRAVERKRRPGHDAADGAHWQPFDMRVL